MRARLVGTQTPFEAWSIELDDTKNTVGRDESSSIFLEAKSVSRKHAIIYLSPGGFTLHDLGTSNGTQVNGKMIHEPVLLKDADVVNFGEVAVRFEIIPEPSRPEVSRLEVNSVPTGNSASGCAPLQGLMEEIQDLAGAISRYLPWILGLIFALIVLWLLLKAGGSLMQAMPTSNGGSSASAPGTDSSKPASAGDIEIQNERLVEITQGQSKKRVLLLRWKNTSKQPISEWNATLTAKSETSGTAQVFKKITLYKGKPVGPGEVHEDHPGTEGTPLMITDPQPVIDQIEIVATGTP